MDLPSFDSSSSGNSGERRAHGEFSILANDNDDNTSANTSASGQARPPAVSTTANHDVSDGSIPAKQDGRDYASHHRTATAAAAAAAIAAGAASIKEDLGHGPPLLGSSSPHPHYSSALKTPASGGGGEDDVSQSRAASGVAHIVPETRSSVIGSTGDGTAHYDPSYSPPVDHTHTHTHKAIPDTRHRAAHPDTSTPERTTSGHIDALGMTHGGQSGGGGGTYHLASLYGVPPAMPGAQLGYDIYGMPVPQSPSSMPSHNARSPGHYEDVRWQPLDYMLNVSSGGSQSSHVRPVPGGGGLITAQPGYVAANIRGIHSPGGTKPRSGSLLAGHGSDVSASGIQPPDMQDGSVPSHYHYAQAGASLQAMPYDPAYMGPPPRPYGNYDGYRAAVTYGQHLSSATSTHLEQPGSDTSDNVSSSSVYGGVGIPDLRAYHDSGSLEDEAVVHSKRKSSSVASSTPMGSASMITDAGGIPWLNFEYTRERVKSTYLIRCDIDRLDESLFSEEFRLENCVYPRAMVPPEEYRGHRQHYETVCNQIGWRLVYQNPILQKRRGLIQRAVDTFRNSSRDLSIRSRRARRLAKQQEAEKRKR